MTEWHIQRRLRKAVNTSLCRADWPSAQLLLETQDLKFAYFTTHLMSYVLRGKNEIWVKGSVFYTSKFEGEHQNSVGSLKDKVYRMTLFHPLSLLNRSRVRTRDHNENNLGAKIHEVFGA